MWTVIYYRNRKIFRKLSKETLFRFQWKIEKLWQELGLSPGYFPTFPLRWNMIRYNHIWCMKLIEHKYKQPWWLMTDKLINLALIRSKFIKFYVIVRMGFFGAAHRWGEQKASLPKICHTYPTIMKHRTFISYLKKIQKTYKSRDTPLQICWD